MGTMTTYTKSWMNEVWLVWSVLQLPLILLIDNLELYPERLWKPAGSPLHFAYGAKQDYIAEFNDPIPQWSAATASGHDSWMGLFCHLEVIFALPIILFTIFRLGIQRRGTSGAHELLMLVYAFEAAFTTFTCMNDVLYWDATVYPAALKQNLLTNMYAPFLVIPSILFVDMASRILGRFREADALLVGKKTR